MKISIRVQTNNTLGKQGTVDRLARDAMQRLQNRISATSQTLSQARSVMAGYGDEMNHRGNNSETSE